MHRLSGLDAGFLYLETPTQLLHVCGLIVLDPTTIPDGYRFETLRAGLAVRLPAVPLFRQKIADSPFNLDHPVWVDDPDFDLDRHLHRVAVPAPGRREELAELCGHIAAQPLDRSRPLWEMTVIEGLEDGSVAVMTKIHHAGADGVTGAELVAQLCSLEPDAPRPDPVADGAGGGSALEIALGGLFNVATRPLGLVRALPKTVELLPRWISRARRGEAMPAPFTAPRTSFNGTITGHRSVGFTQFDLDRVKAVKDAHGVKVNDVVMAVCAGALRRYLTERDELPDSPLIGMVPVSVRGTSDRPGRNQVSPMFASLHTHITDPIERLHAIADANACAKEHNSALGASLLQDCVVADHRLAHGAEGLRQLVENLMLADTQLMVAGGEALGDQIRVLELVAALATGILETNGEGQEVFHAGFAQQADQHARIDAAGKQYADIHRSALTDGHGFAHGFQCLIAPFLQAVAGFIALRAELQRPPGFLLDPAVGIDAHPGGRRQFFHACQDGARRRHYGMEVQVMVEGDGVQRLGDIATLQQGWQRRGETQALAGARQVQWFDAETVAGDEQALRVTFPDGEGEHAVELGQQGFAPGVITLEQYLGVTAGEEAVAQRFQFAA